MSGFHVRQLQDDLRRIVILNHAYREFIPEGAFDRLMTPETVGRVYREIVSNNLKPADPEQQDSETHGGLSSPPYLPHKRRSFHVTDYNRLSEVNENRRILALLVFIGREDYILSFLKRGRGDISLPLSASQLRSVEPYLVDHSEFLHKQYAFLAIRFYKGMEKEFGPEWILPFLKDEAIPNAKGAYGKIYRVSIHPDYYDSGLASFWKGKEPMLARKELTLDEVTDSSIYEFEKNALKILHLKNPNIIPLLGTYKYGDKYNFLFPKADCDLDKHFQEGIPPQTPRERYNMFAEISKLALALDTIHDCKISYDFGGDYDQIGYHRDLKPKNILKLGDSYMISDLGLAVFRDKGPASNTVWLFGESTYYAPECKQRKAGRLADIWSLGCIFSEVVSFVLRGPNGVREYWDRRKRDWGDGIFLDYFYSDDQVSKDVLEWFEDLRLYAEHDPFIIEILSLVEDMLTPAEIRPRANVVDERFSRILKRERERRGYEEPGHRAVFTEPEPSQKPESPREPGAPHEPEGPQEPQASDSDSESQVSHVITETPEQLQQPWPTPPQPLSLRQPSPTPSVRDISRYRDQPKTTGPPPLYYKNPGFVQRSQKGKNPFSYLKEFDTVFLIDDSESMSDQWNDVALALYRFTDLAARYDGDGVELYFTDSKTQVKGAKTREVFETFQAVQPVGASPLTLRLEEILSNYVARFISDRSTKRLNLIVITNGDITSIESPADPIVTCAQRLDNIMAPTRQVGVQFALIGSDEEALQLFGEMDDELWRKHKVRDMVDTTPYDPDKNGRDDETLLKIMCGAVNRLLDQNDTAR